MHAKMGVGSNSRKSNSRFDDLLKLLRLADRYRLDDSSVPTWTWSNDDRSIKSYIDMVDSFSFSQFSYP